MILICVVLTLAILLFLMPDRLNAEPVFRPQFDQGHVAGLEENLASVMALSEEELVRLIPNRSGFRFVDCPNCAGGAEENQLSWSIEEPDRVFCQFCNMRFPNELYPENGVMRVTNPRGEVQEYPYWEAPFPPPAQLPGPLSHIEPDKKYRHYFRAKGWYVARMYFSDAAYQLGKLYYLTGRHDARPQSGADSGSVRSGLSGVLRPVRRALPDQGGIRGRPHVSLSGVSVSGGEVGLLGVRGYPVEPDPCLRSDSREWSGRRRDAAADRG